MNRHMSVMSNDAFEIRRYRSLTVAALFGLCAMHARRRSSRSAFTLLELLVVIGIITILLAITIPVLAGARREGMTVSCGTRLRELGNALQMYANDYDGRLMPAAYWSFSTIGTGPVAYWWGTNEAPVVDHEKGFVWPYLQSHLDGNGVFECPEQPWGSYTPQGAAQSVTSTYGYNGYYLSPEYTPGWGFQIANRPWQSVSTVRDPARVFAFGDAAIDLGAAKPTNNALLDPPRLFSGSYWSANPNPTTSFRHMNRAQFVHVEGHVATYRSQPAWITSQSFKIGAVGVDNGPHYVPDWRDW